MKKIRSYLAVFALAGTLIGSITLGIGAGPLASTASSQHVHVASMSGKSTHFIARSQGWCPIPGIAC